MDRAKDSIWRRPNLVNLWIFSGLLEVNKIALYIMLPPWLYHITLSPSKVALTPIADMIGVALSGIIGGPLADHHPKTASLVGAIAAAMLVLWAIVTGSLNWWVILLWTLVLHIIYRFLSLSRTVMVNLLARDRLVEANTIMGTIYSWAKLGGALLASGYFVFGYKVPLMLALASQIFMVLVMTRVKLPTQTGSRSKSSSWMAMIGEAVRHIQQSRVLQGGVVFFSLFMIASAVFSSLFYVFLIRVAHLPPAIFPMAMTAQAIGGMVVARSVTSLHRHWPAHVITALSMALTVLSELMLFAIPDVWLILISMVFVGVGTQIGVITAQTVFQQQVEVSLVGRTLGVRASTANLLAIAASLLASLLVQRFSSRIILLGSLPLLAIAVVVGLRSLQLKRNPSTSKSVSS